MKRWKVTFEVNMCAEHTEEVIVTANTERKAKIFAEQKLKKRGCFHVRLIRCAEIKAET